MDFEIRDIYLMVTFSHPIVLAEDAFVEKHQKLNALQHLFTWKGQGTSMPNKSSFKSVALIVYKAFFSPCETRYSSVSFDNEYPLNTLTGGLHTYQVTRKEAYI